MDLTLETLAKEEIDALERSIDEAFEQTRLPDSEYLTSAWTTSSGAEHLYRYLLTEACQRWHQTLNYPERSLFIGRLDRYKYELRQALLLCKRKAIREVQVPAKRLTDEALEVVASLMIASDQFAEAIRLFSSYRSEKHGLSINRESGLIYEQTPLRELQYASLELHVHETDDQLSPILSLITIFSGPSFSFHTGEIADWAPWLHEILSRVRVRRGRLQFQISIPLARHFFDDLYSQRNDVPVDWTFPWGTADACHKYFCALNAILFYNMFCVHFGAMKLRLANGGTSQFCMTTETRHLNENISTLSGLPRGDVSTITAALTLGEGIDVADPALQPIIPVGPGTVSIPGIFVASSNWPRNLMSLHARVSPKTFDRQSSIFEFRMIASATQDIPSDFIHWENINLNTRGGYEEIDLLIADPNTRTLLVWELRWMIQPGDIREVLNRQRVLREKVAQVERKCRRANSSLRDVGAQLGITGDGWNALGLVIVDGYGGTLSPKPNEFPIIPLPVFKKALKVEASLPTIHSIFCTPLWLPQPGRDINIETHVVEYFGHRIQRDGFSMGDHRYLSSVEEYLKDAAALPLDKLAAAAW